MASVWGELKRRNVVKVAVAYAIVGWLLVEVSSVLLPAFEAPDWVLRVIVLLIVIGFVLALVLSWAYEITPEGMKKSHEVEATESITHVTGRKLDFAIIGALVLALGFVVYNSVLVDSDQEAVVQEAMPMVEPDTETPAPVVVVEQREVLPNSVAVLPFRNDSPDPNNAYYASGIHEEILNHLVKLSALNVIARTSVEQYRNTVKSIPEIARELNVETVMEGSVRYAGGQIRITAQLNDGVTGAHLWSETYTRDFEDIFAIESDVAMNVANAVGAEFSIEEQASIEKIPTESREAYALYLRSFNVGTAVGRAYLEQAIEVDADFALAYARKAFLYTYDLLGVQGATPAEAVEAEGIVRESAERALSLDPSIGLAHSALATIHYVHWRGTEAENAYRRAYELYPAANVLLSYGRFKRYRGDYAEAIELLERAVALDPLNVTNHDQLGLAYRFSGDYAAAITATQNALELAFGSGDLVLIALSEIGLGNYEDAAQSLQISEQLELTTFRLSQIALAYSLMGRRDDAVRVFDRFEESTRERPVGDAVWARAYLAIGDFEQVRERLESALANRVATDLPTLTEFSSNTWNVPELAEPEFQELFSGLWDGD